MQHRRKNNTLRQSSSSQQYADAKLDDEDYGQKYTKKRLFFCMEKYGVLLMIAVFASTLILLSRYNDQNSNIEEKLKEEYKVKREKLRMKRLEKKKRQKPQCDYFKNDNASSDMSKIPTAILHIGPHKTGSTSMQGALSFFAQALSEENYYFLGKVNKEYEEEFFCPDLMKQFFFDCVRLENGTDTEQCRKSRERFSSNVQRHRQHGHNIILSEGEWFFL